MNFLKFTRFCRLYNKAVFRYICSHSVERKTLNTEFRTRLASAYRGLDMYGLNEGICNHLSALAPSAVNEEEVMLIIPYGLLWSQVTPSKLIGVNDKNEVIEGDGQPEVTALCIHRGVYHARPDVKSVMHTHMPYATALSCLQNPQLLMLHQNSARFHNKIAYDQEYGGLGSSFEEGHRLGQALGDKSVLFMGNHGVLTVANSIAVAFDNMYYLERAAMFQVLATSTHCALKEMPQKIVESTSKEIWDSLNKYAEIHLDAIFKKLQNTCKDFC